MARARTRRTQRNDDDLPRHRTHRRDAFTSRRLQLRRDLVRLERYLE